MADPTTVTPISLKRAGNAETLTNSDETNGNRIVWTGKEMIRIANSAATPRTITIHCQGLNHRGLAMTDITKVIGDSEIWYFAPWVPQADWADTDGYIQITYSAGTGTSLKLTVLKLLDGNPASETES